jgi:hypothetical protein
MMVKPILGLSASIANVVMAGDIDKPEHKAGMMVDSPLYKLDALMWL